MKGLWGTAAKYSDEAIAICLRLSYLLDIPLRGVQGLVRSWFRVCDIDLPVPHYSRLSRRAKGLEINLAARPKNGKIDVVIDATGLPCERNIHTGDKEKIRVFLEAIFWMARSGAQWRFLPEHYGGWNGVYQKFERWCSLGVWRRLFHYFSQDKDMEWLMIDSTIVRAHACASGAKLCAGEGQ